MEDGSAPNVVAAATRLGAVVPEDDCMNEDLVVKLRLLGYESDFCKSFVPQQTFKPLGKSYFMSQAENANFQFFYFTSLTAWLLQLGGQKGFAPPAQFEDPTASVANLLAEVKKADIPVKDFAPSTIRQGFGESVLLLLLLLADRALIVRRFSFRAIEYPAASNAAAAAADASQRDGSPVGGGGGAAADEEVEDRVGAMEPSDDDNDGAGGRDEAFVGLYGGGSGAGGRAGARAAPTTSQVSAEDWTMETEQVAAMLMTDVGAEVRDWRSRVDGALTLMKAVDAMYPEVRAMLERVGDELDKSLDRIRKREQTLGAQFVEQVEDYRGKLRLLNTKQDQFNVLSSRVSGLTSELNNATAALEEVKAKIQEFEDRSTDTTPLARIKEAVAKVRSEIKEMSLRIGVLQHTVLHYALRQQKERKGKQALGIAAAGDIRSNGALNGPTAMSPDHSGNEPDFSGYV
jgi:estrogen-related receptor beta like 1